MPAPTDEHDQRDWGPARVRVRPGLPVSGMPARRADSASLAVSSPAPSALLAAGWRTGSSQRGELRGGL